MANKLKQVFSNEEVSFDGKLNFQNQEFYQKFLAALELVQREGRTVKVDGVTSLETMVRNGNGVYPFKETRQLTELVVGPSMEEVSFELDTEFGKRTLTFDRYYTNQEIVLQTSEEAIVYLKLIFEKESLKNKFTYRAQPKLAKSIGEVVEAYYVALAFFDRLFRQEDDDKAALDSLEEAVFLKNMKDYFRKALSFYKKLAFVEQEFGIAFEPEKLTQDEEARMDLEELYLLLKEKRIIRLNAKLTETEATGLTVNQQAENIKIGGVLDITFISRAEYSLWGHTVVLYTANLLSNAIVKELKKMQNDEVRILYGEEDSRPMYISYRAFKTEEEAREEMKTMIHRKDLYAQAQTVSDYISVRQE